MQRATLISSMVLGIYCLARAAAAGAVHDGDINIDGQIDLVDLLWAQQALQGSRNLTIDEEAHGDVAPLVSGTPVPDGIFSLGDMLIIQRRVLGLLGSFFPANQFNIGDSIGEGEAADGTIGEAHHETVWSTGYDGADTVTAFNERFENTVPGDYFENDASRDLIFNHAVSGSEMTDFATQAQAVTGASVQTPSGDAGMVTVFLGNNDVCAASMADMTDPSLFEAHYRAGLDVLASSSVTQNAQIHVSGIPALYWLWNAKRTDFWCRVFVWPFVPCENLLDNPSDDCVNSASREDPDNVYAGDGTDCQRRKEIHRLIRDTYNPILRDVLNEYRAAGDLPNASYIDIFDVRFDAMHVNGGDCFHPSTAGHALLAEKAWCRTQWGNIDAQCSN